MKTILIINGQTRNGLAITRSLGKAGHKVLWYSRSVESSFDRKVKRFRSRYCHGINFYDTNLSLQGLISCIEQNEVDVVFAAGTKASNFLSMNKNVIGNHCLVAAEDWSKQERLHDKNKAGELVKSLGVNVPRSLKISSNSTVEDVYKSFGQSKIILKYSDSYASKGLQILNLQSPEDRLKLSSIINSVDKQVELVIQEVIQGELQDSAAFSDNGTVLAILTQRRIQMAWIDGGGGIENQTTHHEGIIESTNKILNYVAWSGPIEMDWIVDNSGKAYFIEVNPKYWGTTQLTISSGFDFPKMHLNLLNGLRQNRIESYALGLTMTWIGESLNQILYYRQGFFNRSFRILKLILKVLSPWHLTDLKWKDPLPEIFESYLITRGFLSSALKKTKIKR